MRKPRKRDREETIALRRLGKVIQQRRRRAKLSQEELANRAGVHRTYISDVESGLRNMSLLTISRIAKALDVGFFDITTQAFCEETLLTRPLRSNKVNGASHAPETAAEPAAFQPSTPATPSEGGASLPTYQAEPDCA